MTAHLLGSGTERSQGRLGGFHKFNYAPSLAEAVSILSGGVPESLRGASEIAKITVDFTDNDGLFSGVSGATVTAADGVFGRDNVLSIASNGTSSARARRSNFGNQLFFKTKITIMAARPAANVTCTGFRIVLTAVGSDVVDTFEDFQIAAADTWESFVSSTLSLASEALGRRIAIYPIDANGVQLVTSGDIVYVDDLSTFKLGLTSQLPPESIQLAPGQWLDTSGNGKNAYIPDGFRLGAASRSGDLSSVLTWAASSTDPRYVTGVNASAVPANSAVTIYARADASGTFNIGDGSNATYYASAVSIGTAWTPITLTNPANDGTNRKIVLTPASAYAGSVTISAQVQVLA